ncbi:MAG: hypothetical protein RL708_927 [Bacteroidota bacterium]
MGIYIFSLLGIVSCQSNTSHPTNTAKQDSIDKQQDSLDAEAMHDLAPAVGILPK